MRYSNLKSTDIETLNIPLIFESKVNLATIGKLQVESSKYSTYTIGEAKNEILVNSFQDNLTISKSNLSTMTFKGKYTKYNLTLAQPSNYQFIYTPKYGKLDYGKHELTIKDVEKTSIQNHINGYFNGANNANAKLSFDCFESTVKLN